MKKIIAILLLFISIINSYGQIITGDISKIRYRRGTTWGKFRVENKLSIIIDNSGFLIDGYDTSRSLGDTKSVKYEILSFKEDKKNNALIGIAKLYDISQIGSDERGVYKFSFKNINKDYYEIVVLEQNPQTDPYFTNGIDYIIKKRD